MAVSIDFCCNDPDNGNYVGKFHMMQVRCGDIDLEFDGPWSQSEGITFRVDGGFAFIGRIKVKALAYREWVGNWCWNSISVAWPDALRIINYLGNSNGGWHLSGGDADLFDAFNERKAITPQEWRDASR